MRINRTLETYLLQETARYLHLRVGVLLLSVAEPERHESA